MCKYKKLVTRYVTSKLLTTIYLIKRERRVLALIYTYIYICTRGRRQAGENPRDSLTEDLGSPGHPAERWISPERSTAQRTSMALPRHPAEEGFLCSLSRFRTDLPPLDGSFLYPLIAVTIVNSIDSDLCSVRRGWRGE